MGLPGGLGGFGGASLNTAENRSPPCNYLITLNYYINGAFVWGLAKNRNAPRFTHIIQSLNC